MKKYYLIAVSLFLLSGISEAQIVKDATSAKSGKIRVNHPATGNLNERSDVICDTIRFPMPGEITYYYFEGPNASGYLTGNNSYKDKVKAEYFTAAEQGSTITGIIAEFAIATSATNPDVTFAIWDNTGANGKPGTIVASATKSLASIVNDVQNEQITTVMLNTPFEPTTPFYAGVILPVAAGDTLALWCRKHESGYDGTAWDQWSDGSWYAVGDPEVWQSEMEISFLLHPIVCKVVGIDEPNDDVVQISPNPSNGIINITTRKSLQTMNLEVYDMRGSRVYARSYPGSLTRVNIDLSFLPKGIYMVSLSDGSARYNRKVVME